MPALWPAWPGFIPIWSSTTPPNSGIENDSRWIHLESFSIPLFGGVVLLQIGINPGQAGHSAGIPGILLQHFLVKLDCLLRVLFVFRQCTAGNEKSPIRGCQVHL